MQNIKQLLTSIPALNLASVSDVNGNVSDSAGQGETDVLSAVASLSLRHLDELSELLGLGPLQAWCFGTERAALYVVNRGGKLIAATSESGKNVETTLKNMIQVLEAS